MDSMDFSAPKKQMYVPDWSSGLPNELLESISKKLCSPIDYTIFRSICENWRFTAKSVRFAPLLLFPLDPHNDTIIFYSPSDKSEIKLHLPEAHDKVICGSSHGCLVLMDEMGGVSIVNPFTKFQINLPPADEEIASASSSELTKQDGRWMIKYIYQPPNLSPLTKSELSDVFFKEIILLSPPKYQGDDFVAVSVLGSSTRIAFCRRGDPKWTLLNTMLSCTITAIVCYQDKLFVMDYTGEMAMCDIISNHTKVTVLPTMNAPPDTQRWKLVASEEGLFLVAHLDDNEFEDMLVLEYYTVVYRAVFSSKEPFWCKVESIGSELSMFISEFSGAHFVGKNISGCEGECLQFSGVLYNNGDLGENGVHSIEVLHLPYGPSEFVETCHAQYWQPTDAISWFRPNLLLVKE